MLEDAYGDVVYLGLGGWEMPGGRRDLLESTAMGRPKMFYILSLSQEVYRQIRKRHRGPATPSHRPAHVSERDKDRTFNAAPDFS